MYNFIYTLRFFVYQTLEKSSRLSEKELAETATRWAAEKAAKVEASSIPEISEYDVSKNNTNKHLSMIIYFIHSFISCLSFCRSVPSVLGLQSCEIS